MKTGITEEDARAFRGGEMVLAMTGEAGTEEKWRGKIWSIKLLCSDAKSPAGVQCMDIKFAWIMDERIVHKSDTKTKLQRAVKCLRYWLRSVDILNASIQRDGLALKFTTVAGERCTWYPRGHPDTLQPKTIEKLFEAFQRLRVTRAH